MSADSVVQKAQLHDAIAKLTREKQTLESQVKTLLHQKIQLEKTLAIDLEAKKVCEYWRNYSKT